MANANQEDLNQENQTLDNDVDVDVGGGGGDGEESSSSRESTEEESSGSDVGGGLTERLRSMLSEEGDGDLENNVLQWLPALDLQVIGACRADERLKPLLKLNVSSGVVEDHLLLHLSQHFEVPEVGMLARCLCIPLVSIRVGRVMKRGPLLCPTGTRGKLNLTLLPSSGLRISYVGDDGCIERLATLSCSSESLVVIEEIAADKSGRSFLVKLPDGQVSYFWSSEQSKRVGFELLAKMKDLLRRKPSLADLTGITESRLDCFATYLRSYLGATSNDDVNPTALSSSAECGSNFQVPSSLVKPSRSRCINGQAGKPHSLYQGSLSPRSNSFKDGAPRSSSTRSGAREKFRRRDIHCTFSAIDASASVAEVFSTDRTESRKVSEGTSCSFLPLSSLDSIGKSASPLSLSLRSPQISTNSSTLFSPYYCWCPPCTSALQYTFTPPHFLISSVESASLPPLSTLLSDAMLSSSLSPPKLPFDLADAPSLDFPALLPDPVIRVPLPVSSFITISSSQQIPIFTPLMCDPIVHIPVIDFCSSGQGYLVSAGPTISTGITPLHPNFVNPMMQDTESLVEKNARETLRLLLSSTQADPQLLEILPSVFTSTDSKHSMVVGSRGLYSGTRDVETIANSIAAMGLPSVFTCSDSKHNMVVGSRSLYGGTRDVETIANSIAAMGLTGIDVTRGHCDHNSETRVEGNRDSEGRCCVDDDTEDCKIVNDIRESLDAA